MTLGKPGKLKLFYKQEAGGGHGGVAVGVLSVTGKVP